MPDDRQTAIRELVMEWLRFARSDLSLARMTPNEEILPEILAFHAQQAVEKAIKALLVQRQVEFPHTHVIGVLIQLCKEAGYNVGSKLADASVLTRYAVATRYPGEMEAVTGEEARQAAELAGLVCAWVEDQIEV